MAYKRLSVPTELFKGEMLTKAMAGIGMRFAVKPIKNANIENTLVAASIEGMDDDDLRVLSMLVIWIKVHYSWINADRLTRMLHDQPSLRTRAFWAAIASWLSKDRRFSRVRRFYAGDRINLLRTGTEFQIQRRGEDDRFKEGPLRIPAGVLRDRASDILSPAELAKVHHTYHHRILMGPSYRADMWAALLKNSSLSASELARQTYGSFATAWQVKKDFEIIKAA